MFDIFHLTLSPGASMLPQMAKISLFVLNKITLAFATYSIYSGYYW
jgi:hypothetical protein